jgi:hypothetical protein
MNFDLRLPIGIMFTLFGALITIFGLSTRGSEIYQHSLGININIRWGLVLLVFGLSMLMLALKGAKNQKKN